MAWRRIGYKLSSEPSLTQFNDACMRHQGGWLNPLSKICHWGQRCITILTTVFDAFCVGVTQNCVYRQYRPLYHDLRLTHVSKQYSRSHSLENIFIWSVISIWKAIDQDTDMETQQLWKRSIATTLNCHDQVRVYQLSILALHYHRALTHVLYNHSGMSIDSPSFKNQHQYREVGDKRRDKRPVNFFDISLIELFPIL